MKEKYENLEKIIFFCLLVIALLSLPVLFAKTAVTNEVVDKKIKMLQTDNRENKFEGMDSESDKGYPSAEDKSARDLSGLTSKRNIFTQQLSSKGAEVSVGDSIELLVSDIGLKPLEIEYNGNVFFKDDRDMVAQVNVHKKSYLVKKGSSFASYKVQVLTKTEIKVKDKKGKIIKIKYREKTYTNELMAQIKELKSGYSKTVSKNDTFLKYKVLDIDEESVLLSLLGQHLRLEKGMVRK